jgi:hypothetical protein
VQKTQIEANNRMSAAFTDASNMVRGAANAFGAARGALQRYMQSVNNNRILDAGGTALEASLVNARRQDDQVQQSSFEEQIRDAERTGSQAAAAAFAGVGGSSSADMVSLSTRLSQQRAAAAAETSREAGLYDASRRAGAIHQQMVGNLDTSIIFDNIDYQVDTATKNHALNPFYVGLGGAVDALVGSQALQNYGQNDKPNQRSQSFRFNSAQDSQQAYDQMYLSDPNTTDYGFGAGGGGFGFD